MVKEKTQNQMDGSWMDRQTTNSYTLGSGGIGHVISDHLSNGTDSNTGDILCWQYDISSKFCNRCIHPEVLFESNKPFREISL